MVELQAQLRRHQDWSCGPLGTLYEQPVCAYNIRWKYRLTKAVVKDLSTSTLVE